MSRRRSDEVIAEAEFVTIGELVRLSHQRYSTLKHYVEIGLLPFEQADTNLTRRFPREASLRILERILSLREDGKSLGEIEAIMRGEPSDPIGLG